MTPPDADPAPHRRATARLSLTLALGALALWVSWAFVPALIWAAVIAIAFDPLIRRAERADGGSHRTAIAAGFVLGTALMVLVPVAFGVTQAAREVHELLLWMHEARAHGVPVPDGFARLPLVGPMVAQWWQANLADPIAANQIVSAMTAKLWSAQTRLIGVTLLHRSVEFAFTLLTLFFLIRDRDSVVAQFDRFGTRLLGESGERIGRQAILSVRGTIDGLVLVGIGEGAVMAVVYLLCGVPHPVLLGVATAIGAMIPFGAALMFAIAVLLLIAEGAVGAAILVVAIGLAVVFVADHFIRPALIGSATRLPFLWVLIGILGGVETLGLMGLFVGPAVMAVLMMLWRDYVGETTAPAAAPGLAA